MLLATHHLQVQPAGWEGTALDALPHSVIACKHEKMVRRVVILTSGTCVVEEECRCLVCTV